MKKKKTIHEIKRDNPDKVEERELTAFEYVPRAAGRSGYRCYCPFCDVEVFIFAWCGQKKCECGALLDAYVGKCLKLKDKTKEQEKTK